MRRNKFTIQQKIFFWGQFAFFALVGIALIATVSEDGYNWPWTFGWIAFQSWFTGLIHTLIKEENELK